ncbi:Acetyltransferase, GNAT family [uncultured Eubacteriales bacterium]|uniref:Acetyltransferase, GNAT family n=1 Tax=uncultured Eubacteriales bacterium TaxID=172733 RepID=A0A212KHP3_9FIRM|nr:Acetyltransferase, GNAT family [uncultured Eubacteriales bacterium]
MRHLGTKPLETGRLILRPFTAADAPNMLRNWAGGSEVTKHLTWSPHGDEAVSLGYIQSIDYEEPETYNWGIVLKELGQVIGNISVVDHKNEIEMVHIGYCLGRDWWHMGIMSEAFAEVIHFFFEEVGVNRIETRHDPRNPNSGKVMQKCGLTYEGVLRQSDRNNRGLCDAKWYAILREDYV